MTKTPYIVVIGGRESGVGAALLAQQEGYRVFLSEYNDIPTHYKQELEEYEIPWEEHTHTFEKITKADQVVKSPGIPNDVSVMEHIKSENIPVLSDIEWAAQHTDAAIIGITGSNGKSTCTALTHDILKKGGLNVGMAGNIGHSFAREVAFNPRDYYVIEVSSFQLEHIQQFKPHVAVLLNITPDHLDRYDNDFQKYINAKFKISQNQQKEDFLVYGYDDDVIQQYLSKHSVSSQKIPFSAKKNSTGTTRPPTNTVVSKTGPFLYISIKTNSK